MIGLFLFYCTLRFRSSRTRIAPKVLAVCLLASIVLSAGCGEDEVSDSNTEEATTALAKPLTRPHPIHSVSTETVIASSPAADSLAADPATQSPELVCRAFMERLQNEDRIAAENLLTRAALTTTQRANLKLEPISSPNADLTIHPARYNSNSKFNRTAEVDCVVTDAIDGETVTISLTWQVVFRPTGWRVCGMLVPIGESDQTQLLSFESIDDVATIKLLATGEAIADSKRDRQFRQAEANEHDTSLQ